MALANCAELTCRPGDAKRRAIASANRGELTRCPGDARRRAMALANRAELTRRQGDARRRAIALASTSADLVSLDDIFSSILSCEATRYGAGQSS